MYEIRTGFLYEQLFQRPMIRWQIKDLKNRDR